MVAAKPLPGATAHRSAFASLLLGVGLALTLCAAFVARRDWVQLKSDTVWELDTSQVANQQGLAWLLRLPEGVPPRTPADGASMLVYVDGSPLTTNDNHSVIREQGGGIASVWGEWVYLSTRDGSDPRSNGRQYSLVLPDGTESSAGQTILSALMIGLAVAALGLLLRPTVPRILFSLIVLALPVVPTVAYLNDNDWSDSLAAVEHELSEVPEPVAAASSRPVGNTLRLMPQGAPIPFEVGGPLATVHEPVRVTFEAEECLQGKDGVFRLQGTSCCLIGRPDREMNAPDVGELVLTVRILEGDTLSIEWIQKHDGYKQLPDIVLPVRPSPDWQTLRISDPLGIYLGSAAVPLQGFRLGNGSRNGALVMEVGELIATDRRSLYTRSPSGQGPFERNQQRRPAHWQSAAGTFRVPWPRDGGRLFKGAVCALTPAGETEIPFELLWEDQSGSQHNIHASSLSQGDDWLDVALRIPADADPAALLFRTAFMPTDGVLVWAGWRLVDDTRPPRRVFLTVMDTLRADGLSCYGGDKAQTPGLDALADLGTRFDRAIAQCYWTRPSMASLMTGRYVPTTGVHSELDRLPESFETLAEAFAKEGFYTAGLITNTNAGPMSGLDQGWDEQVLKIKKPPFDTGAAFIETYVDPASERLLEEDLLFYVHLMDAHGPYGPVTQPENWEQPGGHPVPPDPALDWPWVKDVTDETRVKLYYMGVEALDATWSSLLGRLRERWDTPGATAPVVAVAADHGEYLGEYGQWSHVYYELTPEVVHVPLIISAPGLIPQGEVVSAPVENIDLAPTLLELAGLSSAALGGASGRSLVPLAQTGESSAHGPALSSAFFKTGLFAAYTERGGLLGANKLLSGRVWPGGPPLQTVEDALGDDLLGRWVTARLKQGFLASWGTFNSTRHAIRETYWRDIDESVSQLDPSAIDQLRQMGYLR